MKYLAAIESSYDDGMIMRMGGERKTLEYKEVIEVLAKDDEKAKAKANKLVALRRKKIGTWCGPFNVPRRLISVSLLRLSRTKMVPVEVSEVALV